MPRKTPIFSYLKFIILTKVTNINLKLYQILRNEKRLGH